jgi:V-type H+-transporting ATPase subunit A
MEVAKIIREDFLKQNAFSEYDYYCPLNKTIGMMKTICYFYENCIRVISESSSENKVSWSVIETKLKKEIYDMT